MQCVHSWDVDDSLPVVAARAARVCEQDEVKSRLAEEEIEVPLPLRVGLPREHRFGADEKRCVASDLCWRHAWRVGVT